jgi:hypothetical protein
MVIILKLVNFIVYLQSVSANFSRSSSELYLEMDKLAGKLLITFRNSESISELRFEIRKFISHLSGKLV